MSDTKGNIGIDENFLLIKYFTSIKLASISPTTAVKLYSNILDVGEIVDFLNWSLDYRFLILTVVDRTHCTHLQGMSFLLPLFDWLEDYQVYATRYKLA